MSKKYKIFDGDSNYTLNIDEGKEDYTAIVILKTGTDGQWCVDWRDKQVVRINDNGNGVVAKVGNKKIKLGYSEEFELYVALREHLLTFNNKSSKIYERFKLDGEDSVG